MEINKNFEILKSEIEDIGLSHSIIEEDGVIKIKGGIQIEELKIPYLIVIDSVDIGIIAELPIKGNPENIDSIIKKVNEVNAKNIKYGKYEVDIEDYSILYTNFIYIKEIELPIPFIKSFLFSGIYALDKFAKELQKDLL